MAKKKTNNQLEIAGISAVLSLFIVLVFFGGSLTGNATYVVNVDVASTTSCAFTPSDGSTLDFGSISAGGADSNTAPTVLVENDGSANVDITATPHANIATFIGGSGTSMEVTMSGNKAANLFGTAGGTNMTLGSGNVVAENLTAVDSVDDATLTLVLEAGSSPTAGNDQTQASGLIVACS